MNGYVGLFYKYLSIVIMGILLLSNYVSISNLILIVLYNLFSYAYLTTNSKNQNQLIYIWILLVFSTTSVLSIFQTLAIAPPIYISIVSFSILVVGLYAQLKIANFKSSKFWTSALILCIYLYSLLGRSLFKPYIITLLQLPAINILSKAIKEYIIDDYVFGIFLKATLIILVIYQSIKFTSLLL